MSEETTTGLSHNKLAMWVFLGSECLLFGALISTYLLYRNKFYDGPAPGDIFDIPFTSVSSFVLLMSSLTMVLALSALQKGDIRNNRLWLLTTALLGAVFIGGQVYEFTTFIREGLGYTTSPLLFSVFHSHRIPWGSRKSRYCNAHVVTDFFLPRKIDKEKYRNGRNYWPLLALC